MCQYSSCPVCNLHLQSFIKRQGELRAAGIREVVLFHSEANFIEDYYGELQFDLIADPWREIYARYRVETSPWAILSPLAWPGLMHGYRLKKAGKIDSTTFGLPADFLIDEQGRIFNCKYGEHSSDQWSVDEVVKQGRAAIARRERNSPQKAGDLLLSAPVSWLDVGDAELAYRVVGSGPPLLLLHGYPLNGLTFRSLVPSLARQFSCYVLDLQGAGHSRWTSQTDFGFEAQAQRLKTFVDRLP